MKIAIYTLGCKVNQYETQAMEQALRSRGHEVVAFSEAADAYMVNSCSVTAVSDQKSRQALHKIRREHPKAVLALCGCYAQTHPDDVENLDVDLISGTGDRRGFIALLEQAVEDRRRIIAIDQAFDRREFEILPAGGLENRTRAMLKVEDGCVNFCSYCIIPYARGPVRSLPPEQAAEQAEKLAAAGYREIVLTGIEISSWGRDLNKGLDLIDLIETVCRAAPGVRIRLGSLEPRTVTEDFCRRCAALPELCPQFHLSLQSGCDETLRRMNRKYDTARYLECVELLNRYFDRPALTTDLITGFPEETEDEFDKTLAFIRKCGFAKMHIFPYSIRPGTPAAKMRQLPKAVKTARAEQAAAAAAEMRAAYLRGCVGQIYPVLFEQSRKGRYLGHAPNYMEVLAEGADLHNTVKNVRITGTDGEVLLGGLTED